MIFLYCLGRGVFLGASAINITMVVFVILVPIIRKRKVIQALASVFPFHFLSSSHLGKVDGHL